MHIALGLGLKSVTYHNVRKRGNVELIEVVFLL